MRISIEKCRDIPPEGVYPIRLPLQSIHVLEQMRKNMSKEGLDNLTAGIRAVGQKTPGTVVGLNLVDAIEYLFRINKLWGTKYSVTDFEPTYIEEHGSDYYLFLVAGHRRLKAVALAPLPTFRCELYTRCNLADALVMQYQENSHEAVAQEDEARFITLIWRQYQCEKQDESENTEEEGEGTEPTLRAFAKKMGKPADLLRKMLRFTSLPMSVQALLNPSGKAKGVPFGLLCELSRLQEALIAKEKPFSELELKDLAYTLVAEQRTVKAAAAWVSEYIHHLNSKSPDMFGLSIENIKKHSREVVRTRLEGLIRAGSRHMELVGGFHEDGIPKIASGSTVNAVVDAAQLISNTAPKIVEGVRGGRNAPKARQALEEAVGE